MSSATISSRSSIITSNPVMPFAESESVATFVFMVGRYSGIPRAANPPDSCGSIESWMGLPTALRAICERGLLTSRTHQRRAVAPVATKAPPRGGVAVGCVAGYSVGQRIDQATGDPKCPPASQLLLPRSGLERSDFVHWPQAAVG